MTPAPLPISLADLLAGHKVELDRIELKAGWNPPPIFRTICGFANDFHNIGGGYVVVGIGCVDGQPQLPPAGVPDKELDLIQRKLVEYGKLLQPSYFPLFALETYQGKNVLVLWCPGGQNRPYRVPEDVTAKDKTYRYYIRRYSSTVEARDADLQELMTLTAKVPFDDRVCHPAELDDLKLPLIRSFLREVKSDLYARAARVPLLAVARQMALVDGPDEYVKPRNVGLMFFHEAPEKFFPGTQIDLVQFPQGVGGSEIVEQTFRGPLHTQIRDCLGRIRNTVLEERVTKLPDQAESVRRWNYPYAALEEAIVNAVYHRGYDQREPIEVRVNPDCIEVVSYPGPDPSIQREQLADKQIIARRYRNRRIGDFLKELELTEGRSTGIPKIHRVMRQNGSPVPVFESDEGRTYFIVRLPIHPAFLQAPAGGVVEAHDKAHDEAHDELNETEIRVLRALQAGALGTPELLAHLGLKSVSGGLKKALERLSGAGLVEFTIPDRPRSKYQKRRLTEKGRRAAAALPDRPPAGAEE